MYHINIEDLNPPLQANHLDYSVNITANITDSAGHSFLHDFAVRYIPRPIMNITISSTMSPPTTPVIPFLRKKHPIELIGIADVFILTCIAYSYLRNNSTEYTNHAWFNSFIIE